MFYGLFVFFGSVKNYIPQCLFFLANRKHYLNCEAKTTIHTTTKCLRKSGIIRWDPSVCMCVCIISECSVCQVVKCQLHLSAVWWQHFWMFLNSCRTKKEKHGFNDKCVVLCMFFSWYSLTINVMLLSKMHQTLGDRARSIAALSHWNTLTTVVLLLYTYFTVNISVLTHCLTSSIYKREGLQRKFGVDYT